MTNFRPYFYGNESGLFPVLFTDENGIEGFCCPICGPERRDYGTAARTNISRHIELQHSKDAA